MCQHCNFKVRMVWYQPLHFHCWCQSDVLCNIGGRVNFKNYKHWLIQLTCAVLCIKVYMLREYQSLFQLSIMKQNWLKWCSLHRVHKHDKWGWLLILWHTYSLELYLKENVTFLHCRLNSSYWSFENPISLIQAFYCLQIESTDQAPSIRHPAYNFKKHILKKSHKAYNKCTQGFGTSHEIRSLGGHIYAAFSLVSYYLLFRKTLHSSVVEVIS